MARKFTREEVSELARQLSELSVRDTDFERAEEVHSDDLVAIVQNGVNKTVSADAFTKGLTEEVKEYVDTKVDECKGLVDKLTEDVDAVKSNVTAMQTQIDTALGCLEWKAFDGNSFHN